jgi:hypothetical protein
MNVFFNIFSYPTGCLRPSARGMFSIGGGVDMPCVYVIYMDSRNDAESLAGHFYNCPVLHKVYKKRG